MIYLLACGSLISPSAQYFALRALQDRIATKKNLLRRSIHLVDSLCVLCGSEEETTSHLLISCPIVNAVRNSYSKWIGVSFVNHFALKEHFEQFNCTWFSKEGNKLWKRVWVSIIWCIWKHRNEIVFNQAKVDASEIFSLVQVQSWAWLKNKLPRVSFSFSDWVKSLTTCINMETKRWSLCGLKGRSSFPIAWLDRCTFYFFFMLWLFSFLVWEVQFSYVMDSISIFCFAWLFFVRVVDLFALFWQVCFLCRMLREIVWYL